MWPFTNRGTNGAFDNRPLEARQKDFKFEELVSTAASVSLAETNPDRWKIYPKRNQDGSNSCVYQARAKAAGILEEQRNGEFVEYSAADYNYRSNAPAAGSSPVESFDNWRTRGVGLESLEPSQNKDDAGILKTMQSEFEKRVAVLSKIDNYFVLPAMNFDSVISTLQATKKPIPMCFFGTYSEWNRDIPTITSGISLEGAEVRHCVCATPNFGIWNGQAGFTIEDSWGSAGIAGTGVRWITRSFMARNYIAGIVPTSFKTYSEVGVDPNKPQYSFMNQMEYGQKSQDIVMLQNVLKFESFFPVNHSSTGFYGEVTRRAVLEWQKKHQIASLEELTNLGGRKVGPKSLEVLNQIYGN